MSGQRALLLLSAASLALVVGALVLHEWFWVGAFAILFAVSVFAQPWVKNPRVGDTRVVFDNPQTPKPATTPIPRIGARPSDSAPLPVAVSPPISLRILPTRPSPPPLPPPDSGPVDDQIPVAPESGLTIRTRSETKNLRPHKHEVIPLAPEAGLAIRMREPAQTHPVSFDDIDSNSGSFAFAPSQTVRDPIPPFDRAVSRSVAATTPPPVADRAAMSAQELAAMTIDDIAERLGGPRIKYALTVATLTLAGVDARRKDGFAKLIPWDAITSIVARRLPPEAPFDGATFVDIVSMPGATLRILPWTTVVGMPTEEVGEARARTLVNLIAARCVDARLDVATQLFAQQGGAAVQLPTTKLLAAHDERFA